MEDILLIGLVMAFVEAVKHYVDIPKPLLFLPVLGLAIGLNMLSIHLFGDGNLLLAAEEGLKMGALAAGIYGLGKAALGKS